MDWTVKRPNLPERPRDIKYSRHQGRSGYTWYVGNAEEVGWYIYVDKHRPDSRGFDGRGLEFPLDDGTTDYVKGPWLSNADALFTDTGVDARDQHFTFVALSEGRLIGNYGPTQLFNVAHLDEGFVLGRYDRWKHLAALHPEAKFFYMIDSLGGASYGSISDADRETGEDR